MANQVTVRPEAPADAEAVRRVNLEAFGEALEANIVDALRDSGNGLISLVAEIDGIDGDLVGHVMFSPLTITSSESTVTSIALGPLAVMPAYQKRGVGSALVQAGIEACREAGHDCVFVLGHVSYYPRFGFQPARPHGVIYKDGRDSFMVLELQEGALAGLGGTAAFAPEFAVAERPYPA